MNVTIPCPCPPKADGAERHESDTVTLRDRLDFRQATALRNEVAYAKLEDPGMSSGEIMATLTEGYVLYGIEAWSVVGEDGKARPVTKPAIRELILADPLMAESIGEAADGLYGPSVLAPLVARALSSSEPSPTDEPTSAPPTSPKTSTPLSLRQKRAKRSSTSTTRTDSIEATTGWHGGVSSSSPSSATVA